MTTIELVDQIAFIGVGERIAAVDISNTRAPQLLWQTGLLGGIVQDITIDPTTGFLIVAAGYGGVAIVDPSASELNRVLFHEPTFDGEQPIHADQLVCF